MKKASIGIAIVLFILMMSGCPDGMIYYSFSPPQWIQGKWETEEGKAYITITSNDLFDQYFGSINGYSRNYKIPEYDIDENPSDTAYSLVFTYKFPERWGELWKITEEYTKVDDDTLSIKRTREFYNNPTNREISTKTLKRIGN